MADLRSKEFDQLLTRLDELVRWRPGETGQYLDPHGQLERVKGSANHIIQGRRGSGKTRLLDELRRSADARSTVIRVGAEDFKQLSYPDILIQILLVFLRAFHENLSPEEEFLSPRWWRRKGEWFRHPLATFRNRRRAARLASNVKRLSDQLLDLYDQAEARETEQIETQRSKAGTTASLGSDAILGRVEQEAEQSREVRARQTELKKEKVERLLPDFKRLLDAVAQHLQSRLVLAVDDFYFVRRDDQPAVIDYIHRICKDTKAYLKVATIRHRSHLFERGDVIQGIVPGHEVQTIDLELPLGQFESVTRFLERVWIAVCREVGIAEPLPVFRGQALHQLVLASGGVPRDFFGIAKAALVVARERGEDHVGKLRVNEAAREYTERTKFPEVELDAAPTEAERNILLVDILRFAREEKKRNCIHVDIDQLRENPEVQWLLDALVDARLLHLITDNTSNAKRAGRYAAYLIDVGLYAHPQRRGDRAISEIAFWDRDSNGRLQQLNRAPVYPIRSMAELRAAAAKMGEEEVRGALLPDPTEDPNAGVERYGQLNLALPVIDVAD